MIKGRDFCCCSYCSFLLCLAFFEQPHKLRPSSRLSHCYILYSTITRVSVFFCSSGWLGWIQQTDGGTDEWSGWQICKNMQWPKLNKLFTPFIQCHIYRKINPFTWARLDITFPGFISRTLAVSTIVDRRWIGAVPRSHFNTTRTRNTTRSPGTKVSEVTIDCKKLNLKDRMRRKLLNVSWACLNGKAACP